MKGANLILILGDQLSPDISALRAGNKCTDHILMAEVADEATYVNHHKKKIAFVFSAMRHFAEELQQAGWSVRYVKLDDHENSGAIESEVQRIARALEVERVILTEPGEWRLSNKASRWARKFGLPVEILDDDRFICSHKEFSAWADGRKQLRMEFFYREMRRKTGLLMNEGEPEGGQWNYDAENRKPPKKGLVTPRPLKHQPDAITSGVIELVSQEFGQHFGDLEPFWFGVTRSEAQDALDHFVEVGLPAFGDYQDAMVEGEKFMFHSLLSIYLNVGLLSPIEVCQRVERAFYEGNAPLNAVEGFIRQIIGWREFIRGVYWLSMPNYVDLNYFKATRPLPDFYWSGATKMNCMRNVIGQTKEEAYAHHIQRLMITGNFALLAGIDPKVVHEWYLSVYADAYEWVEAPNTLGMSQFADGGRVGSKPYAASGNYINRMSNYCSVCHYDVKKKTGEKCCPFNPLYWDFVLRNEGQLRSNPRMAQIYRNWDRIAEDKKSEYKTAAAQIFQALESAEL